MSVKKNKNKKALDSFYQDKEDLKLIKPKKSRWKTLGLLFLALIFGFIGAILAEWFLSNYLFVPDYDLGWLKKLQLEKYFTPKEVVIRKQEKVTVSQDQRIAEVAQRVRSSIAAVFRLPENSAGLDSILTSQDFLGLALVVTTDGWLITTDEVVNQQPADILIKYQDQLLEPEIIRSDNFYHLVLIKVNSDQSGAVIKLAAAENINLGQLVFSLQINWHSLFSLEVNYLKSLDYLLNSTGGLSLEAVERLNRFYLLEFTPSLKGQAIFNLDGEVVGLCLQDYQDYQGQRQPLLLTSGLISSYLNSGLQNETVPHVYLGLNYLDLASSLTLDQELTQGLSRGALVISDQEKKFPAVVSDSPADQAGLQSGDIITQVNKEEVNNLNSLSTLVRSYQVAKEIELIVLRQGEELVIPVTLGKLE